MYTTAALHYKAKKQYQCDWCCQRIEIGDAYSRYRFYDGGEASTMRMHPECFDAAQDFAHEEGGFCEFVSGQERPPPLAENKPGAHN